MCWLSLVVRSPPARRSLSWIQSLLIELWLLVIEVSTLTLILLTTQTMVTTGILPLQGKIPMVEPGIETGTSWLVVRSSDHQTTWLVRSRGWSRTFLWLNYIDNRETCLPELRIWWREKIVLSLRINLTYLFNTVYYPHTAQLSAGNDSKAKTCGGQCEM